MLVQLCKQVQADVAIHMGPAGTPLLAEATWSSSTAANASHMAAEILLATIGESVQVRSRHGCQLAQLLALSHGPMQH